MVERISRQRQQRPRSWTERRESPSRRRLVLLAALMGAVAALLVAAPAGAVTIPSAFFVVTDQQGANDVPGQVDLTQMGRDDSTTGLYNLFWSWDSTSFTSQTGDACALFDFNGNGGIDAAVCSEVHSVPSGSTTDVEQTVTPPNHGFAGGPPYVFRCSDAKTDRCANPSDALIYGSSDVKAGVLGSLSASPPGNLVTNTDPFGASAANGPGDFYPNDTTLQINISQSYLVGLATAAPKITNPNPTLVNVCSYPSAGNGGNNNPFD
jgi:hypothetical protein